jgi:Serine incorporator (Serinc)
VVRGIFSVHQVLWRLSVDLHVLFAMLSQVILSLTLVLCVIITVVQLSGVEGNLLASAAVSCYAVFLAFSAVSSTLQLITYMHLITVFQVVTRK